jgi:hypothetical protein
MSSARTIARALSALVGPSAVAVLIASGCEPQEIYLFDGPPSTSTQREPDAGDPPDVPSTEADAAAPPPAREQPACESAACESCVERGACNIESTVLFCHPVTGDCELLCDAEAPAQMPGNCPSDERCDARIGLCVECVQNTDCYGPLAACDIARGTCVECVGPETCPVQRPVCDVEAARCIECNSNADCAATGEVCLPGPQRCVQCRNDADCAGRDDDVHCLAGELRCVECVTDDDCVEEPDKPFCSSELECEDERQ